MLVLLTNSTTPTTATGGCLHYRRPAQQQHQTEASWIIPLRATSAAPSRSPLQDGGRQGPDAALPGEARGPQAAHAPGPWRRLLELQNRRQVATLTRDDEPSYADIESSLQAAVHFLAWPRTVTCLACRNSKSSVPSYCRRTPCLACAAGSWASQASRSDWCGWGCGGRFGEGRPLAHQLRNVEDRSDIRALGG